MPTTRPTTGPKKPPSGSGSVRSRRTRTTAVFDAPRNEVRLQGKLAAEPDLRTLPSGDEVVTFRLVVARRTTRGSRPMVDTIDCTAWSAALRRRAASWRTGELLAVEGALRRRFWRSSQGPRSRYDVEVTKVSRVRSDVPSGDD